MLKSFKLFLTVVLVSILIIPALQAAEHTPAGKWWRIPKITQELELTEKQIDDLENLYHGHNRKLILLKKELESEQFELEILMESKHLDIEKATEQHERLEKSRGKLARERFGYFLEQICF